MEIEVQLYASLRQYLPRSTFAFTSKIQVSGPKSIRDIFAQDLNMPEEAIKTIMIIMLNGSHAEMNRIVNEGDILIALPIATGG